MARTAATVLALGIALGLAACQPGPAAAPAATTAPREASVPLMSFAQGACGGCHAVEPDWLSPNPQAPSFASIANREGLTSETLSHWLRSAHNYPEAMDFDLTPARAEELTAYILTLRDPAFEPPSY